MIRVEDAWRLVEQHLERRSSGSQSVTQAHGLVLDEEIISTIDSPSYDKAQVDGFAVRCEDVQKPGETLRIAEEITAGQVPTLALTGHTATRIMTGAPVPVGADAVVMVERSELIRGGESGDQWVVRILETPRFGQNIMRRGEAMRQGDVVLTRGHLLRSIEIGLLTELGRTVVNVILKPTVGIISTGNELVSGDQTPGPGQIRNSNGPMLESLVREASGETLSLGIVRDTEADLTAAIRRGLECDVLLLSGGVSAGVLDLVPRVLTLLGVDEVFHKVQLKPGKPLWFGVQQNRRLKNLVFGLPGNPVSSLVCFEIFVRPALARMAGRSEQIFRSTAELKAPFRHRGDRPTFYPGRTQRDRAQDRLTVQPLGWRGSADLRTLADADVLICFEPGDYDLPAGASVSVRWF